MRSVHTTLAALLLGAVLAVPAPDASKADPTVTASQGKIIGTTTTLSGATAAVNKFLGIPFAISPPERFFPPKPAAKFGTPFVAHTLPPACIQQLDLTSETARIFNNPGASAPPESEDCLYLNVWTPPKTKSNSKLPVLFWIFGGNLQFGTGSLEYYDGSSFAYHQDVIVVTHNYRTNVFGFSNSPEIPLDQVNAGFLDQRLALKWVHDNIAHFGGDPAKVTIFGESAGGYSVKQLMALPPTPSQFRGAIMESEATLFSSNSTVAWETLMAQLDCTDLACVQQANASQIRSIIVGNTEVYEFAPVEDKKTQISNVTPQFTSGGGAAKVPFLIGTNADEGRVFAYVLGLDEPGANLTAFIQDEFSGYPAFQEELELFYAGSQSAYLAASEIITDEVFQCHAADFAQLGQSNGYKVWRYLFNATFPNTRLFPDPGAYHSVEIPEVFGTYAGNNEYGKRTKAQVELSKYMQSAWANFAKNPSKGPGWAEYGTAGNVANLGGVVKGGEKIVSASSLDGNCALYTAIIEESGP